LPARPFRQDLIAGKTLPARSHCRKDPPGKISLPPKKHNMNLASQVALGGFASTVLRQIH
jgi:hypothetical protein